MKGQQSNSGVYIYADFRDNLIIDRYDPIFQNMRAQKINHLRSENSEDAITWNVFRTMQQIDPKIWLPRLFQISFNEQLQLNSDIVKVILWKSIEPPKSLETKEGPSEVDIIIETEEFVWSIEAKYKSDISKKTTHDPNRNQIIRNIDVGSHYAKNKDFYFSLLILDEQYSPIGFSLIEKYIKSKDSILDYLLHRKGTDQLNNVKEIGFLTWGNIRRILEECAQVVSRDYERYVANQAIEWLDQKGIL